MKKSFGVVLPLAAVGLGAGLIAFYSSCGNTGGGVNLAAAFGQFISQSCSPEGPNGGGNCLSLAAQNSISANGQSIGGFRAQLVDGSSVPLPGVRICFAFENPSVATILEPTNACGLTDGNGLVSGQFRAGTLAGSFQLVATAPAGFGLQARRTISFVGAPGVTQNPGNVNSPCASSADCNSNLFCSFNDTCFPGESTCTQKAGTGAVCCANEECVSGTCDGGACIATASGAKAVGQPCSSGAECASGFCGGAGPVCLGDLGDPCAVDGDCGGGNVCTGGSCSAPPP